MVQGLGCTRITLAIRSCLTKHTGCLLTFSTLLHTNSSLHKQLYVLDQKNGCVVQICGSAPFLLYCQQIQLLAEHH